MPNTISGRVVDRLTGLGLDGVTVTYTGAASGSALTTVIGGVSGSYLITGLADGTYTLAPTLAGYAFAPTASLTITLKSALPATSTLTRQDFVGFVEITGRVTDVRGRGVPGVTVAADPSHLGVTDADGYYAVSGLASAACTLTPSRGNRTYTPASRSITPPVATSQDFVENEQTFLPLISR
jgi:hypothetical protein